MTPRERCEALILTHAAPVLKAHGYRKKAMVWTRQDSEFVRLFTAKFHVNAIANYSEFGIALDLFNPAIHAAANRRTGRFKTDFGIPRTNAGRLLSGEESVWVRHDSAPFEDDDVDRFIRHVHASIDWLDSIQTPRDAYDWFLEHGPRSNAIYAAYAAGLPGITGLLEQIIAADPAKEEYWRTWAAEHGIDLTI